MGGIRRSSDEECTALGAVKATRRPVLLGLLRAVEIQASLRTAMLSRLRRFSPDFPTYGMYLFRHSFAKALIDRWASMPTIQNLLGHYVVCCWC